MDEDIITGRDFVIVGIQNIDDEFGNIKNIAYEISKNNRVLFVHLPPDRISAIRSKNDPLIKKKLEVLKGKKEPLEKIKENLWSYYPRTITESINWIKSPKIFDFMNKINSRSFSREINRAIKTLRFKDVIIINDNDFFRSFYLKDYIKTKVYIYYMRDFFTYMDYWKAHGTRLEPKLIAKADLALANSIYLAEYCSKFNKNSFYVGQGCDSTIFRAENIKVIPNEIKALQKPIIGYVGAIVSSRLSIEIIAHIAKNRPEWTVALVGPEDDEFKNSKLHHIPNIHFLGKKPITEVPTYISQFDVCINPQLINPMTIGNYPLKIDEYLAMGKPVVATRTKAMEIFETVVYVADNKEDYLTQIEKALSEKGDIQLKHKRKEVATSHSWENNVKEIYRAINKFGNKSN